MSKNKAPAPPRRSTRQTGKVLSVDPTPRGPLKRTKKLSEDQSTAAPEGIREVENGLEDEESPSKKLRFDSGKGDGDGIDENEMEVQESAKEKGKNEDQEMDEEEEPLNETGLTKICKGVPGDVNLFPRVVLGERCRTSYSLNEDSKWMKPKKVTPEIKEPCSPAKSSPQNEPLKKSECVPIRSMADYKRTMEAKARSSDVPKGNHFVPSTHPALEKTYTTRQRVNNIPKQKETVRPQKQDAAAGTKRSSGNSCRGFVWYLWRLVFLLLLSSATLLAYKIIPVLQRTAGGGGHSSRTVKPEIFSDRLSLLRTQFPNQQPELWRRSRIHLEKHLTTAHPTEPVSLILTAGLGAERTMQCLARSLASTYSSALNASVLHLDGKTKSGKDSDEVKLDIDTQLETAFEGDKPVAVVHRFEELPPGATLIFYRYCDHETAAYKQVFLLFTVLLPQDQIRGELSLEEVEEMVHDYLEEKLARSTSGSAHNEMDIDKFSGLWSRISHLVLPVVSEETMEQGGCP